MDTLFRSSFVLDLLEKFVDDTLRDANLAVIASATLLLARAVWCDSFHCVCFTRASLSISEDRCMVTLHNSLNQLLDFKSGEHVVL